MVVDETVIPAARMFKRAFLAIDDIEHGFANATPL